MRVEAQPVSFSSWPTTKDQLRGAQARKHPQVTRTVQSRFCGYALPKVVLPYCCLKMVMVLVDLTRNLEARSLMVIEVILGAEKEYSLLVAEMMVVSLLEGWVLGHSDHCAGLVVMKLEAILGV